MLRFESHPQPTTACASTTRVVLRGLSVEDRSRFLEVATGATPAPALARAVHVETNGNPFFVGEVIRLLADDGGLARAWDGAGWRGALPQGVREVIARL